MRIIQLIAIVIVFWLLIRMLRHWYESTKGKSVPSDKQKASIDSVVKCEECGLHIPEKEAIRDDNLFFCSHEHRDRYRA